MSINRGKQFEQRFRNDWLQSFPDSFCLRLPDQQSGYYGTSQNICDFICYVKPILYLLELKSHDGNTFPISNLKQYNKLILYKSVPGIKVGVIIWYKDHKKVIYVPINTIEQMIQDNLKSINIKTLSNSKYEFIEIPSITKVTFPKCDYKIMYGE